MEHTRRRFLISTAMAGAAGTVACGAAPRARPGGLHVVLAGDSILDNGAYVGDGPSVVAQLTAALGDRGQATLLARDGAVIADVAEQLAALPEGATHVVVSAGGNDALQHVGLLDRPIASSRELLAELAAIRAGFRDGYAAMLAAVRRAGRPFAVCTIYDSNYDAPKKQLADVALAVFNDAILRCAGELGVPVIDLRRIFRAPADYANAIEPSPVGGAKMVGAIVEVAARHDFTAPRTVLYP